MVLLQLLNLMAPCYFLCLLAVTFSLQLFFFLPGMCEEHALPLSGLLHSFFFVFFLVNVIGNYFLVIWNSPASGGINADADLPDKPFCRICNRMMWEQEHHCFFTGTCIGRSNLRSFVLFCLHASCSCFHAVLAGVGYIAHNFSLSFANPLTLLRLLPLSVTRFFSGQTLVHWHQHGLRAHHCVAVIIAQGLGVTGGSLLSSEMLAVLMLYLWLGVGLACGAFCCHQLLLISRRPMCHQSPTQGSGAINWMENMTSVFGKSWLMAILFPGTKEKLTLLKMSP